MTREERRKENYNLNHKVIDGIIYKQCSKCKQWLIEDITHFYMMNKSKPEKGYQSECKECTIKRSQNYVEDHKDNYYRYNKEHYLKHGEEDRERRRLWQQENVGYRKEYQKRYWKLNPDKVKDYGEIRGHKNHIISKYEWKSCKEYFNNSCAYCGLPVEQHYRVDKGIERLIDLHREHVDHEGSRYLDNCVPACMRCNSTKWKHPMEEWYRQQEFFNEERLQRIYKWINEDYKQYYYISYNIKSTNPKRIYSKRNNKSVKQYDLNGELLNTYESIKKAATLLGIDASAISKCCRGKYKKYKGFVWKYTE